MINWVPRNTKIDFIGIRFYAFAITAVLILGSIVLLATKGLNYGIDFTGGTLIEVKVSEQTHDLADLRSKLNGLGMGDISIQEFGAPDDLLIRMPEQPGGPDEQVAAIDKVKATLNEQYEGKVEYRRTEFVGPLVGEELKLKGAYAILFSIIGMLVYIWFRFELNFGIAAIIGLTHDTVATLGLFALTQMPFDLSTVAAVLMIIGYSMNDTVVVFDRIRETLRKYKKMPIFEVLNVSINQTLSRTFVTGLTTLLALIALWIFGGEVIRGFVYALIFGIVVGTYSSIFVAAPLLTFMNIRKGQSKDLDS